MSRTFKFMDKTVRFCLRINSETRNDDISLILEVWRGVGGLDSLTFEALEKVEAAMRAFPPESIRRMRQKIQEHGEFLPTDPEVLKARRRKEKEWSADLFT